MSITEPRDFFIQYHLTERCNLRCSHCYQTGERGDEMSFDEIKEMVEEASDMIAQWSEAFGMTFSPSFNITGGEPFLRHDLYEVLEEIGGRGFEIYLLTNGTLIDEKKARRLAGLGVNGVQVSIEGPEEVHETIRGEGSFSASLRGVRHLLDAGLVVTLNTTLSRVNADRFMDMVALSSSLGVQKLGFSRLVPSGRGKGLLGQMLGTEKVKELYEAINSMDAGSLKIVTGDPVAANMSSPADDSGGSVPLGGCAAGLSGMTIMPDGTITPCRRLPVPIGNVRKDSLRQIWATSEILAALRDKSRYKGKCGRCRRWDNCRGCRAIAYAYSAAQGEGDILAEDPQCFLE
jgi:radical SAM protein with 4Fe4S-binding SPASM domain